MSARNGHRIRSEDIHKIADPDTRINYVLGVVHRRNGDGTVETDVAHGRTPVAELIEGEEAAGVPEDAREERRGIRRDALREFVRYLRSDGVHPANILRMYFVLSTQLYPEEIANMTQKDAADMLGETRAAHSARVERLFSTPLKEKGFKGYRSPGQKTEAAREVYRKVQKGNTNRRGTGKKSLMADIAEGREITYDNY